MRTIRRLIFHHSASSPDTTIESIRHHHVTVNGWSGIAYHFVITGDGNVHSTRPVEQVGAHDSGENEDSIGVCLTGDNTRPDMGWRPIQIAKARDMVAAVRMLWPTIKVLGHRDEGPTPGSRDATLCPGCDVRKVLGVN